MKRCPECGREYDNTMMFCLDDGAELLYGPASMDESATAILSVPPAAAGGLTGATDVTDVKTAILQPPATAGGSDSRRAAKPLIAVVAAVVILVGGFFGYRYFSPSKQINSIAVMPFENRNSDADTDYLSDGLAESVIFRLTQIPDLRVSPTSSVMRYKGRETDVAKIASELGVDTVMTGRLTKRGDNLNITVELVDARTNKSLWGEQYERKLSELLTTQREMVAEIVNKLQLKLSGESEQRLAKKYTDNNEAYQLYLQGRYQWNKRTRESLKQAAAFFDQAIKRDPNFALAYSGLAEAYVLYPSYGVELPLVSMPKAKAAAQRAIELDDSLAETRVALGMYYSFFAWNLPAAEKEFRRAIELNPNYASAHQQYGTECLSALGRFDEAIAEGKRAEELDPVSPIIGADVGQIFLRARRYDEAIEQLKRVIVHDPNFWVAYRMLGMAYHGKGQYREAVAVYRKSLALNDDPHVKARLILALVKTGERSEAVRLFDELQAASARQYVPSWVMAIAHNAFGEKDKAFALLNKEITDRGSVPQLWALVGQTWDDFRDDPRFAELVRRVEASKLE